MACHAEPRRGAVLWDNRECDFYTIWQFIENMLLQKELFL